MRDQIMSRRIRTTIDFGDDGLPLAFLSRVTEAVTRRHRTFLDQLLSGPSPGFVPISMARYVELHLAANPGTEQDELTRRLTDAVSCDRQPLKLELVNVDRPTSQGFVQARRSAACYRARRRQPTPENRGRLSRMIPDSA